MPSVCHRCTHRNRFSINDPPGLSRPPTSQPLLSKGRPGWSAPSIVSAAQKAIARPQATALRMGGRRTRPSHRGSKPTSRRPRQIMLPKDPSAPPLGSPNSREFRFGYSTYRLSAQALRERSRAPPFLRVHRPSVDSFPCRSVHSVVRCIFPDASGGALGRAPCSDLNGPRKGKGELGFHMIAKDWMPLSDGVTSRFCPDLSGYSDQNDCAARFRLRAKSGAGYSFTRASPLASGSQDASGVHALNRPRTGLRWARSTDADGEGMCGKIPSAKPAPPRLTSSPA